MRGMKVVVGGILVVDNSRNEGLWEAKLVDATRSALANE